MSNESELKERIQKLENEIIKKDVEILNYRKDLTVLNQKIESLIKQMTQQLSWTQSLQKLLSPTEFPAISGFEFSTKFVPGLQSGGDYFDIFEHQDKLRFGIFLSSCSGYSISSVLLSLVIKISSQIESRKGLMPHEVVQKIGQELAPQIQGNDKASLFCATIDRRSYEMHYCLVGSLDVFLQTHNKDPWIRLAACGEQLSKNFNFIPVTEVVQLSAKDRFVLATEGLRNSQDKNKCTWGSLGLEQALHKAPRQGVHELRNEIFYQNEKFSGTNEPLRDQTVVVAQVKENLIKLAKN